MQKVKLIFKGINPSKKHLLNITIYDEFKCKIIDKQLNSNTVYLELKNGCAYCVYAKFCGKEIHHKILVNGCNEHFIYFNQLNLPSNRIITLSLNDYFYNLPIERGVLQIGKNN